MKCCPVGGASPRALCLASARSTVSPKCGRLRLQFSLFSLPWDPAAWGLLPAPSPALPSPGARQHCVSAQKHLRAAHWPVPNVHAMARRVSAASERTGITFEC